MHRHQRRRPRIVGEPRDRPRPHRLFGRGWRDHEVHDLTGEMIHLGSRIHLDPPAVVLRAGPENRGAAAMLRERCTPFHDATGQLRMIRLRNEQQVVALGNTDHQDKASVIAR
jgi:hypothetical protein